MPEGYATLLAAGFDTVEETLNWSLSPHLVEMLEDVKGRARDASTHGETAAISIGDLVFLVAGHGGQGGVVFVLANDDYLLRIRAPETDWNISVRYLSAGLWEHGLDKLQKTLFENLIIAGSGPRGATWSTVKRADFAFDFHAPGFTDEMRWQILGNLIAPAKCKLHPWGTSQRLETLAMGSKRSVEVQVYDKGKEIREASGKEWMFLLWARSGYVVPEDRKARDVWRLEVRFAKEYLRERGTHQVFQVVERIGELVAEALHAHRLTMPGPDSNRRRWPMHPLWGMACDAAGGEVMLPLGRCFTMRREQLRRQLINQAAGTLRAAGVLGKGDCRVEDVGNLTDQASNSLVSKVGDRSAIERLLERYRFIDDAR